MAATPSVPPYVSVGIFNGAVETLAETTVPHGPLDRRVLDSLSGADYGALMSALRFFGFVDENRTATPAYHGLVGAWKEGPPKYKAVMLTCIETAYKPITGSVDITKGTIAQLEKAFRDAGVSQGQMLTKTVRFLIKMLLYCDATVSHHILKGPRTPQPRNSEAKKRQPKKDTGTPDTVTPQPDALPTGLERMPIPGIAGAFIQYPTALTEAQCDVIDAMVTALRAFVKAKSIAKKG